MQVVHVSMAGLLQAVITPPFFRPAETTPLISRVSFSPSLPFVFDLSAKLSFLEAAVFLAS